MISGLIRSCYIYLYLLENYSENSCRIEFFFINLNEVSHPMRILLHHELRWCHVSLRWYYIICFSWVLTQPWLSLYVIFWIKDLNIFLMCYRYLNTSSTAAIYLLSICNRIYPTDKSVIFNFHRMAQIEFCYFTWLHFACGRLMSLIQLINHSRLTPTDKLIHNPSIDHLSAETYQCIYLHRYTEDKSFLL